MYLEMLLRHRLASEISFSCLNRLCERVGLL